MTTLAAIVFWLSSALIVYTHAGYPLALMTLVRVREARVRRPGRESAGATGRRSPGRAASCPPSP